MVDGKSQRGNSSHEAASRQTVLGLINSCRMPWVRTISTSLLETEQHKHERKIPKIWTTHSVWCFYVTTGVFRSITFLVSCLCERTKQRERVTVRSIKRRQRETKVQVWTTPTRLTRHKRKVTSLTVLCEPKKILSAFGRTTAEQTLCRTWKVLCSEGLGGYVGWRVDVQDGESTLHYGIGLVETDINGITHFTD